SSLVLLCELLSKGSLVPDVETDGAYLEAELDHLDQDLEGREGEWDVGHGWTVVREKGTGGVATYRAKGKPGASRTIVVSLWYTSPRSMTRGNTGSARALSR